jgi:hypothetical protein
MTSKPMRNLLRRSGSDAGAVPIRLSAIPPAAAIEIAEFRSPLLLP